METNDKLIFERINYLLIAAGFVIVVIGYFLMSGGKPESPEIYNPEVFSTRRVTIAPIMILIGYGVVMYGIFKRPKPTDDTAD